jgi:4-amino-4-deoxy-L-arabinose transferase-like glycosyltransferase
MLILRFISKYNKILLILLFIGFLFLRFSYLGTKSSFRFDQVDNAWAAERILVEHKFPLIGPADKQGSGIYVGPLYYYLVSGAYALTGLDPIASPLFAGLTAIITFFTIYFVFKKMFSVRTAIIALFLYTVSFYGIQFDRMQWEVNFIPIVSLISFFSLFQIIIKNKEKYILTLALMLGLSLHIHITAAVFLPLATLLSLPFFPRTKKTIQNIILGIGIILFLAIPSICAILFNRSLLLNPLNYSGQMYHGLHLRRLLQMKNDLFIQIEFFLSSFPIISKLTFLVVPTFLFLYCSKGFTKERKLFIYLVSIWFLIPWIVLATYSGEVTNYYYSTTLPIGLLGISYLILRILEIKKIYFIISPLAAIVLFIYAYGNLNSFMRYHTIGITNFRAVVRDAIKNKTPIEFEQGNPLSYTYYYYAHLKK